MTLSKATVYDISQWEADIGSKLLYYLGWDIACWGCSLWLYARYLLLDLLQGKLRDILLRERRDHDILSLDLLVCITYF